MVGRSFKFVKKSRIVQGFIALNCVFLKGLDLNNYDAVFKNIDDTLPRQARVEFNHENIFNLLNEKQKEFVEFVLKNYIDIGVDELDINKLSSVIDAKYGSVTPPQKELGSVQEIQKTFVEFQKQLYKKVV